MFSGGLNPTLTDSLRDLAVHIPHLHLIQQKLLDVLSLVLANKPFVHPGMHRNSMSLAPTPSVDQDPQLIALALRTLGSFDFSKHNLLEFVRECVVNYLDDDNPYVNARTHAHEHTHALTHKQS